VTTGSTTTSSTTTGGPATTGTGGSDGTGGSGTGGSEGPATSTTTGGTPAACTEADKEVCSDDIGTHCGLTYEYWKDRGEGCLVNKVDGFSVEWRNINNLLGRKGVRPGGKNNIVTYEADYRPSGNSYLGVYGWTTSPLIEYYIIDSWGNWRPPGGEGFVGTVESDGGTYDIYKTQRVNQPSIEGNATFYQFWSVRKEKRTSGTITVANHFDAWGRQGLTLGTFYEVSLVVEGYQSNGSADVKVSIE
jgi:endo-1,4-beta-xylanase